MLTEAQKRASKKYEASHVVRITLKLNRKTDADILKKLESAQNKNSLIKEALRKM